MRKTKAVSATIQAHKRGYRVNEEGLVISPRGRFRKLQAGGSGYYRFNIKCDLGTYPVKVHQLAALQWFGEEALSEDIEVRHFDGNPFNNAKTNLKIGTRLDNVMDVSEERRRERALVAARKLRRVTYQQADEIRRLAASGVSYAAICSQYGIASKATVSGIVNRKTYNSGP